MTDKRNFDVIIVGGSYAGLSAGMALGRAIKQILIIDSGRPCNIQAPHSHNFLTQDGQTPKAISTIAKQQIQRYKTVRLYEGLATNGKKTKEGFEIETRSGDAFRGKKLIFGTGIKDIMPDIRGFAECWGISVIHCPYCHGYEVRNEKTGILGNGDYGFEFSKLISNWTRNLTLFTNGKSILTLEQTEKLLKHKVEIVETQIDHFDHINGQLQNILFKDGSKLSMKALYSRTPFEQHSSIPTMLGCELTEEGYIKVDAFQKTTVSGIFACGDNSNPMRSVSNSVSMGTFAGAAASKELIDEEF